MLNTSKKAVFFINRELSCFNKKELLTNLYKNVCYFEKIFKDDVMFRKRFVEKRGCLLFMDGMVNNELINEAIIKPLVLCQNFENGQNVFTNELKSTKNVKEMVSALLYGDSVLLLENSQTALILGTKGWRTRGISEPLNEQIAEGPREGFDEAIMFNAAMLRRKIATPDLCIKAINIGRKTNTQVFIFYLRSLVYKKTLSGVLAKLKTIDIDAVLDTNYLNELINPNKLSFFKTAGTTERPDIVAARILEGRIAVMVDGSPVCLTIPYIYCENFQSDEDYYTNFTVAVIGRVLRYFCFWLSLTLPALYIVLINYNPEFLPLRLLCAISFARSQVPFSSFFEMFLLIFVFEILKETGARMLQNQGGALSIVGGLVIGQAAVEANFVSAPAVIIGALCAVAGICVPRLRGAVFYFRVLFLALASIFGLFGFFIGITVFYIHLFTLKSFGVYYTAPSVIFSAQSVKDTFWRAPFFEMFTRPAYFTKNRTRFKYENKKP